MFVHIIGESNYPFVKQVPGTCLYGIANTLVGYHVSGLLACACCAFHIQYDDMTSRGILFCNNVAGFAYNSVSVSWFSANGTCIYSG